jgi:hypothetical protein
VDYCNRNSEDEEQENSTHQTSKRCFASMGLHVAGSFVTTARNVLGLRIEEIASSYEGSCEYIEQAVADSRQGVPGYISRGPGSIPGATSFSEK